MRTSIRCANADDQQCLRVSALGNALRGDGPKWKDHQHAARCAVGTGGFCMRQSGSGAGIAASTSWRRGCRPASKAAWWIGTVVATAVGVWLITGQRRAWLLRSCGAICLLLPHMIAAPVAIGENSVPAQLALRFTIASVATGGVFWLLAGTLGGFIYSRNHADPGL
jgi:predicted cobalt transporter CbtA